MKLDGDEGTRHHGTRGDDDPGIPPITKSSAQYLNNYKERTDQSRPPDVDSIEDHVTVQPSPGQHHNSNGLEKSYGKPCASSLCSNDEESHFTHQARPMPVQHQTSSSSANIPRFVYVSCESMISWHGDDADGKADDGGDKPSKGKCCRKLCSESEGLEAWLLLVRVLLYNSLMGVNFTCFGLLYVEYTEYFQAPKANVGWVVSIQASMMSLLGWLTKLIFSSSVHIIMQ